MSIRSIKLNNFKNWGPYTDSKCIHLSDKNNFSVTNYLVCIVGENGSGKSAIVEAIEWVLFQTNSKLIRADNMKYLINNESNSMFVELVIESKEFEIIVRRELNGKTSKYKSTLLWKINGSINNYVILNLLYI